MSIVQTILIASGVVGALALLLYFVPASKLRVPAIVLGTVAGIGVGAAIGMAATMFYGDTVLAESRGPGINASRGATGSVREPVELSGPAPKAKGAGGGGQNPKAQLAQLITKLDQLATKSLVIDLTAEQKQKIQEKLAGLDEESELSNDAAKARLDALLEIVKDQRSTLEAAGYRWPAGGGGGQARGDGRGNPGGGGGGMGKAQPAPDVPNPFKNGTNNEHLKSLRSVAGLGEAKS